MSKVRVLAQLEEAGAQLYTVHISEKRVHHITVAAPSEEEAIAWAYDHGAEFIVEVSRSAEETSNIEVETVSSAPGDTKFETAEIWVNDNGSYVIV